MLAAATLDRLPPEVLHALDLHVRLGLVFGDVLRVLEDALRIGFERRLEFLFGQLIPWVVFEPWVAFEFMDAVESKPFGLLSLNQCIYKVPCFGRPTLGDLFFLDLYLLRENLVSDFFARPA